MVASVARLLDAKIEVPGQEGQISSSSWAVDPIYFKLRLQATELKEDVTFQVVFVTDPDNNAADQELENVDMGPIKEGVFEFTIPTAAPDVTQCKLEDLFDTSILYISISYKGEEFCRCGWYLRHGYPEGTNIPLGSAVQMDQLIRFIQEEATISHFDAAFDNSADPMARAAEQYPQHYGNQ